MAGFEFGLAAPGVEASGLQVDGDVGVDLGGFAGYRLSDLIQWDVVEVHYISAPISAPQTDEFGPFTATATASEIALGTGIRLGLFGEDSVVHPYLSWGLGGNRLNIEFQGSDLSSDWEFEWNLGFGVLVDASRNTSMGFRYRYRTSSFSFRSFFPASDIDVNTHSVNFEMAFGSLLGD